MDLKDCYKLLELPPGASPEEIKRAYRESVKIWHPDRFVDDPALQARASERLKEINEAYERILKNPLPESRRRETPGPNGGAPNPAPKRYPWANAPWFKPRSARVIEDDPNPWRRRFFVAVFVGLFVLGLAAFYGLVNYQQRATPSPKDPVATDYDLLNSEPKTDGQSRTVAASPAPKPGKSTNDATLTVPAEFQPPPPDTRPRDYFTVGSTKEEVIAVQGQPLQETDATFSYASASIRFENGRVKSWRDGFPKLKAQLLPKHPVATKGYFTLGSTMDEVLGLQGTPSSFTDTEYVYGSSSITFVNGRVVSWNEASPKLKARLVAAANEDQRDFFTLGSSKNEVLAVQGTPSSFSDDEFVYQTSTVRFENGRVKGWREGHLKLKTRLAPSLATEPGEYFTLGSTRDEVLAIQGSPNTVTDDEYIYRTSSITFAKGRVSSWNNGSPPLKVRLLPATTVTNLEFFSVGSTHDEVLAVQGTPTSLFDQGYYYGTSTVQFENGRVKSWRDGFPALKVK